MKADERWGLGVLDRIIKGSLGQFRIVIAFYLEIPTPVFFRFSD